MIPEMEYFGLNEWQCVPDMWGFPGFKHRKPATVVAASRLRVYGYDERFVGKDSKLDRTLEFFLAYKSQHFVSDTPNTFWQARGLLPA